VKKRRLTAKAYRVLVGTSIYFRAQLKQLVGNLEVAVFGRYVQKGHP
jgi:hypothetical protein